MRRFNVIIYVFTYLIFTASNIYSDQKAVAVEKPLVVIIPSYNNLQWYKVNLDSVLMQNYSNYRVIYLNDHSTDGTEKAVEAYLKRHSVDYAILDFNNNFNDFNAMTANFREIVNANPHFFLLVNNMNRCGALENLYKAIHSCKNKEICVLVDGDDWLYHEEVFSQLNKIYDENIWLTHGTLKEYPWGHVAWCEPISPEAIANNTLRQYKCPSHLRTFYAGLFKKIKLEDLLWNGQFFPMTWDMAMMFPMCEMAAERHAFISEVNIVYNMDNLINDNKINAKLQQNLDAYIRNMPPYERLKSMDCFDEKLNQ